MDQNFTGYLREASSPRHIADSQSLPHQKHVEANTPNSSCSEWYNSPNPSIAYSPSSPNVVVFSAVFGVLDSADPSVLDVLGEEQPNVENVNTNNIVKNRE